MSIHTVYWCLNRVASLLHELKEQLHQTRSIGDFAWKKVKILLLELGECSICFPCTGLLVFYFVLVVCR